MRVSIFTSYFGGPYQWGCDLVSELRANGVDAQHVSTLYRRVLGLINVNTDVVHTTIPFPIKMWRKPILLTVQGDFTNESNILQKYYPKIIRQANAITTSSNYLKISIPLPDKTMLIPNAVFPERFKIAKHGTRKRLNFATIMNFYIKGKVSGLIDMFDVMRNSGLTNFRHIIVGEGTYKPMIEEYARKTKLEIIFSGRLDNVSLVLANSDIFLYYTHQDSFPNVIAEAMASGLPVLTNNFGSMNDIIKHGYDGLVAETPEKYGEYLKRLFDDVEYRRQLGERARESVEEKFSWHVIAKQFMKLYEEIQSGS